MAPVSVLIVDDVPDTRNNVRRLLELEEGFEVVGEAGNGEEALEKAKQLRPDCILMDINMPQKDGIEATQAITLEAPDSVIVIMSVQGEQEYLRKAMSAGARDYLVKPFAGDELVRTLRRVCELEAERRKRQAPAGEKRTAPAKVISVFSTKGGVGKTTLATNLAVLLAQDHQKRVALVDLDLQFGDVAVQLDLVPAQTFAELAREDDVDAELVEQYLVRHASGVRVMAAPARPEEAELVRPEHVGRVIDALESAVDYVVIDMPSAFHETVLSAMDKSDHVLFVVTLDVPTIKNARLGLEVMRSLSYDSMEISIVLNRASGQFGVSPRIVEENLERSVAVSVPSNAEVVMNAVNKGRPFVITNPDADVTASVRKIGSLVGEEPVGSRRTGGLRRILRRAHA